MAGANKISAQLWELCRRAEVMLGESTVQVKDLSMRATEDAQSMVQRLGQYQASLGRRIDSLQRDFEESKLAQDRYGELFDSVPVAYFVLDKEGCIQEVNAMGACQLGMKRETLIGRSLADFIVNHDQSLFQHFCSQLCSEQSLQRCEIDMHMQDNGLFRAQLDGIKAIGDEREVDAQGIVITNISERKRIEASRDMFFSIASHEIRTPLTNISLSLELIARGEAGPIPSRVKDMIDIARHGAMRLTRLVNEVLVIQRLNAEKIVFHQEPLDFLPLVEEAIESNCAYAAQFNVQYVLTSSVSAVRVKADSDRLIQVLNNLLSNASKFSPENDKVEVSVSRHDGWVRVGVSDHGPGIPKHFRGRVFDAFAQARPPLEKDRYKEGAGLGLVIAKTIIEKLGGRIGFLSKPDIVTTFYFELPEYRD
jgi:PAS domain S-box-containing protein